MYRAMGSVRAGCRIRTGGLLTHQSTYPGLATVQRRHFWTGLGKMVGIFPKEDAVPEVALSVPEVASSVSEVASSVPEIFRLESTPDLFPDILQEIATETSIVGCFDYLSTLEMLNPFLYVMDGLHFLGANWMVAILLVGVPLRVGATFYNMKSQATFQVQQFQQNMVTNVVEMQSSLGSRMMLKPMPWMGNVEKRSQAKRPRQYHEVMEFRQFCIRKLKINFEQMEMEQRMQKFLTTAKKTQFKPLLLTGAVFFIISRATRSVAALPLDNIHDPFLFWSDPAIFQAGLTSTVALSFNAIFAAVYVTNCYLNGTLNKIHTDWKSALILGGPYLGMSAIMNLTEMPGYSQATFLFACLGNQALMAMAQNYKPVGETLGYKSATDVRSEYLERIRENQKYRQLLDERAVFNSELIEMNKFLQESLFTRLKIIMNQEHMNMMDKFTYLTKGKDSRSAMQDMSFEFYPYDPPSAKDNRIREQHKEEVEKKQKNYLIDEWTRGELANLAEEEEEDFNEDFLTKEENINSLSAEQSDHPREVDKDEYQSSQTVIPDWEQVAEEIRLAHDITPERPVKPRPWWETETYNKDTSTLTYRR